MNRFTHPRLRPVETFPIAGAAGQREFVLRDPDGFASPIALPYAGAVAASLMNGLRSQAEIQQKYAQITGVPLDAADIEELIRQLDERLYLDNDRFRRVWKTEVEVYLNLATRPPAHAGAAYAVDRESLRAQLAATFAPPSGPGSPSAVASSSAGALRGVVSPHIDLHRGGPTFAHAYRRIAEESQADLFVILGASHRPMRNLFCATKKHFDTPLGAIETDKEFVGKLSQRLRATPTADSFNFAVDEMAHRNEHSIELQTLFLQHLFGGRRPIKIVPILVGSFHEFVRDRRSPAESSVVATFVEALRAVLVDYGPRACLIAAVDLAHIGPRFGDRKLLAPEDLVEQREDDRRLLDRACAADPEGWFQHIAAQQDRRRVCGLSPTYVLLRALAPERGELLKYDQAAEPGGASCVSFASVAFY